MLIFECERNNFYFTSVLRSGYARLNDDGVKFIVESSQVHLQKIWIYIYTPTLEIITLLIFLYKGYLFLHKQTVFWSVK